MTRQHLYKILFLLEVCLNIGFKFFSFEGSHAVQYTFENFLYWVEDINEYLFMKLIFVSNIIHFVDSFLSYVKRLSI